ELGLDVVPLVVLAAALGFRWTRLTKVKINGRQIDLRHSRPGSIEVEHRFGFRCPAGFERDPVDVEVQSGTAGRSRSGVVQLQVEVDSGRFAGLGLRPLLAAPGQIEVEVHYGQFGRLLATECRQIDVGPRPSAGGGTTQAVEVQVHGGRIA